VPDFHRQNTIASTDPLLAINENSARVPCSVAHEWGPIRRGHHRLKLVLLQSKTETLDCSTEISFPAKKTRPERGPNRYGVTHIGRLRFITDKLF
jgi:hypothetical protein